jgi:GNAT superfamily N-acetyltransferase
MTIVELPRRPQYLDRILDWYLGEWPQPGRTRDWVRERCYGRGSPAALPLTLLIEMESGPVGFVTLVLWEGKRQHWIDAVYIDAPQRRRGHASTLIRATERKAAALGIVELFALTDLPALYRNLGWAPADGQAGRTNDVVLRKTL